MRTTFPLPIQHSRSAPAGSTFDFYDFQLKVQTDSAKKIKDVDRQVIAASVATMLMTLAGLEYGRETAGGGTWQLHVRPISSSFLIARFWLQSTILPDREPHTLRVFVST
jgi:hypothetical protein